MLQLQIQIHPITVWDAQSRQDRRTIGGTLHNAQGTIALTNIAIDGSELRARAGNEPFRGTFVNRILNGEAAFGLLVHDSNVRLEGDVILGDLFCRRE